MYKIDCNDEDLQIDVKEIYENYQKYLNKDLKKIFKKILNKKIEFITDKEADIIDDFYYYMNDLYETMVQIREKIDR